MTATGDFMSHRQARRDRAQALQTDVDALAAKLIAAQAVGAELARLEREIRELAEKRIFEGALLTSDRRHFVEISEGHATLHEIQTPEAWVDRHDPELASQCEPSEGPA